MNIEQKIDPNKPEDAATASGAAQAVKLIGYGAHSSPLDAANARKFVGYAILTDRER